MQGYYAASQTVRCVAISNAVYRLNDMKWNTVRPSVNVAAKIMQGHSDGPLSATHGLSTIHWNKTQLQAACFMSHSRQQHFDMMQSRDLLGLSMPATAVHALSLKQPQDSAAFAAALLFELFPFLFLGKLNSDFALLVQLALGYSFVQVGGSTRRLHVPTSIFSSRNKM